VATCATQEVPTEKFKQFYLNDHSGRRLDWRFDQGRAEVQVQFNPKISRTLVVTPYQMLILLCFNGKEVLTYSEILEITGVCAAAHCDGGLMCARFTLQAFPTTRLATISCRWRTPRRLCL
jgi:hypothetical protein